MVISLTTPGVYLADVSRRTYVPWEPVSGLAFGLLLILKVVANHAVAKDAAGFFKGSELYFAVDGLHDGTDAGEGCLVARKLRVRDLRELLFFVEFATKWIQKEHVRILQVLL